MKNIAQMSLTEIDSYGADIQQVMTEASTNILSRANMFELGSTKDELNELYTITKKQKQLDLPVIGRPLKKFRSLTSNYSKVQTRLDSIQVKISEQQVRIDEHMGYMQEQIQNLDSVIKDVRECENELSEYSQELQGSPDEARLQAVASRLRVINSTRVIAEQAQAEAMMIFAEQREARNQLEQVIKNAIPAIQIQAVNSIGIRVNKETHEMIDKTREIVGNIIVQNATDVRDMAIKLQNNRTNSIVDDDKLLKAQDILRDAISIVTEASKEESKTNLRMTKELRQAAEDNQIVLEQLKAKIGS